MTTQGEIGVQLHILNFSTMWRSVVSFTLRSFYPRVNKPDVHFMRLRSFQSISGLCGEARNFSPVPEIELKFFSRQVRARKNEYKEKKKKD
jgi:hypothetical protein